MNQPAVDQDKQASGIYEISLVPTDQVPLIWDKVEKLLKKSANRSNGRTNIETIYYELINNETNLWIVFDSGNLEITGVQITLFNNYPTGKKMLCLEHTAGRKMQEWAEKGIQLMINFAKESNCHGLEGVGRHGQWHWVKNSKKWKRPATFYEYNFEDDV